jgi:hypothetical protein
MAFRIRIFFTVLAVTIAAAALSFGYSIAEEGPFFLVADRFYYGVGGILVYFGVLPFWVHALLYVSFFLLFAAWFGSRFSRLSGVAAVLLFVLWSLQTTGELGLYRIESSSDLPSTFSVWAQESAFQASVWGLVLLGISLAAIALIDRVWKPVARTADSPPTVADERLEEAN